MPSPARMTAAPKRQLSCAPAPTFWITVLITRFDRLPVQAALDA